MIAWYWLLVTWFVTAIGTVICVGILSAAGRADLEMENVRLRQQLQKQTEAPCQTT